MTKEINAIQIFFLIFHFISTLRLNKLFFGEKGVYNFQVTYSFLSDNFVLYFIFIITYPSSSRGSMKKRPAPPPPASSAPVLQAALQRQQREETQRQLQNQENLARGMKNFFSWSTASKCSKLNENSIKMFL